MDFNGLCCNYFTTLLSLHPYKNRTPKAGNNKQCDRKVAFEKCADLTEWKLLSHRISRCHSGGLGRAEGKGKLVILFIPYNIPEECSIIVIWRDLMTHYANN